MKALSDPNLSFSGPPECCITFEEQVAGNDTTQPRILDTRHGRVQEGVGTPFSKDRLFSACTIRSF